jgi:hypothetical protein
MDEGAIVDLVTRLGRPHPSGGQVIERAAIVAAGPDAPAVIAWIVAHAGAPETATSSSRGGGLHGSRLAAAAEERSVPSRYVLPAGVLAVASGSASSAQS